MAQYNNFNIKLSNSQFNKLKSGTKIGSEVTLNLQSNLIRTFSDENNFPHKLLLVDRRVPDFVKLLQMVYHLI